MQIIERDRRIGLRLGPLIGIPLEFELVKGRQGEAVSTDKIIKTQIVLSVWNCFQGDCNSGGGLINGSISSGVGNRNERGLKRWVFLPRCSLRNV